MTNCCPEKSKNLYTSCGVLMKETRDLSFMPTYGTSGARNEFATADDVTLANLLAKIDADKPADRMSILKGLDNTEAAAVDPTMISTALGLQIFQRDGAQPFAAEIIERPSPILKGKIENWRCGENGVFLHDLKGNFTYMTDKATGLKVRPIPIISRSIKAPLQLPDQNNVLKNMFGFVFDPTMDFALMRTIKAADLDFNRDDLYALQDVNGSSWTAGQTQTTVTLKNDYGVKITGLVLADFAAYNVTDSGAVTITGATETSDGVYQLDYASQDVSDVMYFDVTKAGFDGANLVADTQTIA